MAKAPKINLLLFYLSVTITLYLSHTFDPLTPHPTRISILGGDCHTPSHQPLEFQKLSYLVETPLEGIFQTKVLLHYTIMRKIIVYGIKQQR